jgi:NAD(P)-dependent dehydrogenase (short-subunit alcohol dehydrogenase family)
MEIGGRVAIVTGAGRGTGRAIAVRLAAEDVRGMVAAAAPGPHILVNNAGGGGYVEPHFPDADPDDYGATLDLKLRGAMLATPARNRGDAPRRRRRAGSGSGRGCGLGALLIVPTARAAS